ncbi:MAG: ankyrin repeat domain-containing protein [Candidatus Babeliales bacterium]|jgi:hypothetical protein
MKKIILSVLMIYSSLSWCNIEQSLSDALQRNDIESAKKLIVDGADVNVRDSQGNSLLHYAAFFGKVQIVKLLLAAHADVQARNKKGSSSLHMATVSCVGKSFDDEHLESIQLLVAAGAHKYVKNGKRITPIALAWRNCPSAAVLMSLVELGDLL